jgi:hypothetical protein
MRTFFRNITFSFAILLCIGLFLVVPSQRARAADPFDQPGDTAPTPATGEPSEPGYCANLTVNGTCALSIRSLCPAGRTFYPESRLDAKQECKKQCATDNASCTTPVPGESPPGQPASPQGFVPLTGLPGVTDQPQSTTLAGYLNALFRIAIGLGALVGVVKITLAGIKYMSSDAFSSKEEAKKDITSTLLGLLIMLSTFVILNTIYPNILNLNVLQELKPLKPVNSNEPVAGAGQEVKVSEEDRAKVAAAAAARGEIGLFASNIENTTFGVGTDQEIKAFKQKCDGVSGRTERTAVWGTKLGIPAVISYDMVCWGKAPASTEPVEPH